MAKTREHNEWFKAVELGGRKSCPECHAKLEPREWIWSWGEYVRMRFTRIRYCCKACFPTVVADIRRHTDSCGCTVNLIARIAPRPEWMTLDEVCV